MSHGVSEPGQPGLPAYRPITSRRDSLPAWLLLLSAGLLALGAVYFLTNLAPADGGLAGGGPGSSPGASGPPATGGVAVDVAAAQALIEEGGCQGCHGEDLTGQGMFPPLDRVAEGPVSDNLQELGAAHPEDWANLWIAGDSPEVSGLDRRGMPTFAERFTPEEIELIVEYLKSL